MITRRGFLGTMGGLAAGAALSRLAFSEPRRAPLRLLLVHKPTGTVPEQYDCTGDGRDFVPSHILSPFADLREHMTIVDGLQVHKPENTPGEDHANCIAVFLTGGRPYRPNGTHVLMTERPSIDQVLARNQRFVGDTPIRSLQLTADDRGHQFLLRVISHAGHGTPLPPEESPLAAFARVFGTLSDRVLSPQEARMLRDRKQSVLDFTRDDLARIRRRAGNAENTRLDRHLTAIREVERVMHQLADVDPLPVLAQMRAAGKALDDSRDRHHGQIGRAHLDLVRVAFAADLTRIACFTWGSWVANVGAFVPGLPEVDYHGLAHAGPAADEAAVHRWYNEQLAAYLRTLRDTPDVDGRSLLDNTLVVNWTEIRLGSHSYDNIPIELFGGAGGRLRGGRIARFAGQATNDLFRSLLDALGERREVFGDRERNSGPLVGLFDEVPLDGFTDDRRVREASRSLAP